MKIRQGLVSNSSSSSFVLIVGPETYDKIVSMAGIGSDLSKILLAEASRRKILGQDAVVLRAFLGDDYTSWNETISEILKEDPDRCDDGDSPTEYECSHIASEASSELFSILRKLPEGSFFLHQENH